MNAPTPKVTLTMDVGDLRNLFMAGNHSFGGQARDADPLALALDIIEHAAMELYAIHDALRTEDCREDDVANHAWRISRQLTGAVALVTALNNAVKPEAAE